MIILDPLDIKLTLQEMLTLRSLAERQSEDHEKGKDNPISRSRFIPRPGCTLAALNKLEEQQLVTMAPITRTDGTLAKGYTISGRGWVCYANHAVKANRRLKRT